MSPNATGLLSVVIPTFNRHHYLRECIDSVLAQTYSNIEILVVDDGSTDETNELLRSYGDSIRYHYQPNSGQSTARHFGIKNTCGEFLCLFDSDDIWHPDFARKCIDFMVANDAGLVFTNYSRIDKAGNTTVADAFSSERPWVEEYLPGRSGDWILLPEIEARDLFVERLPNVCSGTMVRRDRLVHLPCPDIRVGDDYLFFIQYVLESRCRVGICCTPLFEFRTHDSNIRQSAAFNEQMGANDVETRKRILKQFGHLVSPEQRRILKEKVAGQYFECAYEYAGRGKVLKSLRGSIMSIYFSPGFAGFHYLLKNITRSILIKFKRVFSTCA